MSKRYRILNSAPSVDGKDQLLAPQTVVLASDYDALCEQSRVLREALQPFAKVAEAIDGQIWVQYLWVQSRTNPKENICISADHVRAAQTALTATSQPGGTHEL